jgi:hypothetical protein
VDGTRKRRKASKFDGVDASVEVNPAEMKLGEQEIAVEVVRKSGIVLGKKSITF